MIDSEAKAPSEPAVAAPTPQLVIVALDRRPHVVVFPPAYEWTEQVLAFPFERRLRPGARLLAFIVDAYGACRQTDVCQVINSIADVARGGGFAVSARRVSAIESSSMQRKIEQAAAARTLEASQRAACASAAPPTQTAAVT